jgi:hypothetical protein
METRSDKRARLLAAIDYVPVDRLPVCGGCGSEAGLAAASGRTDYRAHPREVFAEAMRAWDVDLVLQFVLPGRLDRSCGPRATLDTTALTCSLFEPAREAVRRAGGQLDPEGVRDFCRSLPTAPALARAIVADRVREQWAALDAWGGFLAPQVWVPGHLAGICPWMWYEFFGYEGYLMAQALYPEDVELLFAAAAAEAEARNRAIAGAIRERDLIPLVYLGEDICGNRGPLAAPDLLRAIYFPHLRRALAPLADAGIHILWHSDGDINPILADLIACGVDGFQGFEEDKGMELAPLLASTCSHGKPPFVCGSVSVTTTMYRTPAAVQDDVRRMKAIAAGRGGGVILSASSTIMEDTPAENIAALYAYERRW